MLAVLVPALSAHRMFCVAAFLEDNVLVYHFAAHRAVTDGGIVASVITVSTSCPWYFGYIHKRPPCSRAVCNLIHMVMRARAIGKMNLENAEAPMPTTG